MADWHLTPEGRAALSRAHAPDVVCILRLDDGQFALYNHAKQLQAIVTREALCALLGEWPPFPPLAQVKPAPTIDLHELGIL